MRILFAATHLGFLRNFESTLALLAERGHQVHIVTDRRQVADAIDGAPIIERLTARYPGAFTTEVLQFSKRHAWYGFRHRRPRGAQLLALSRPGLRPVAEAARARPPERAARRGLAERDAAAAVAGGCAGADPRLPVGRAADSVAARGRGTLRPGPSGSVVRHAAAVLRLAAGGTTCGARGGGGSRACSAWAAGITSPRRA